MIDPWPTQDPQANLDYWFDLTSAISEQNSPLEEYTITITGEDSGLAKTGEIELNGVVYFWLGTPTEDVTYTITCHFKLENGYADDMSRTLVGVQG